MKDSQRSGELERRPRVHRLLEGMLNKWLGVAALVDQAIVSATSILIVVILARLAGAEQLGLYSLGMTAVFLTLAVQESLITAPYMVFINLRARRGSALHRYTGSALVQTLLLGFLASAILAAGGAASATFGFASASRVAFVLAGSILFILLRELARRDCLARSEMALLLVVDLAAAVIQIGLLLVVGVRFTLDAQTTIGLLALGAAVAFAIWLAAVRSRIDLHWKSFRIHSLRAWVFGKWVLWCSMATILNNYSVHWILGLGAGPGAAGTYEAIRTLASLLNPVIGGLRNILGPLGARRMNTDGLGAMRRLIARATMVIGLLGLAWFITVVLFGGRLLSLFYGAGYAEYGLLLATVAAAFVAFGISMPADQGLWASGRPDINAYAATFSLGVTVTVTLALFSSSPLQAAAVGFLAGKVLESIAKGAGFLRATSPAGPRRTRGRDCS